MGVLYREIERHEVVKLLKQKGYGEMGSRRWALALNKPTGKHYQSGGEVREFVGGITPEQLSQILRHSDTPEEAARAIEAACLGTEIVVGQAPGSVPVPQSGVTLELTERLVQNRVAAEVTAALSPVRRELAELAAIVATCVDAVQKATQKRKPGRPRKTFTDDAPPAS